MTLIAQIYSNQDALALASRYLCAILMDTGGNSVSFSTGQPMRQTAIVMDGCKPGQIDTLSADAHYRVHQPNAHRSGTPNQYPIEGLR